MILNIKNKQITIYRLLDRTFGQALCFILYVFSFLIDLFSFNTERKFCFIQFSEMGSICLSYSAFKHAETLYGKSNLFFITFQGIQEPLEILDIIPKENIYLIRTSSLWDILCDLIKIIVKTRKAGISDFADCEIFTNISTALMLLCGANKRIGFSSLEKNCDFREKILTHKVVYSDTKHISESYLSLVDASKYEASKEPAGKAELKHLIRESVKIEVLQEAKLSILRKLEILTGRTFTEKTKIVAMSPDPGILPLRGWPAISYNQFATHILSEYSDTYILGIGLSSSKNIIDIAIKDVPNSVNLAGFTTSLHNLIELFNICHLLVTNDGGTAHFASLAHTPCITLFGPESSIRYSPLNPAGIVIQSNASCSPCFSIKNKRDPNCSNNVCMQSINIEQVLVHARKILSNQ